uniref:Uncharacterized protein n=1 Tax=Arundo donax TaxID=35708 RepID=A0A0A9GNJ1_ARUDO
METSTIHFAYCDSSTCFNVCHSTCVPIALIFFPCGRGNSLY